MKVDIIAVMLPIFDWIFVKLLDNLLVTSPQSSACFSSDVVTLSQYQWCPFAMFDGIFLEEEAQLAEPIRCSERDTKRTPRNNLYRRLSG
jgi:hypothetical protein